MKTFWWVASRYELLENLHIKLCRSVMGTRTRTTGVTAIALLVLRTGELKMRPAIKWPNFIGFWVTSNHSGGPLYLVILKLSNFVINVYAGNVFTFCIIKIVTLHQMVRWQLVTFHWLFSVQVVANSDSQISEVNFLSLSFTKFSCKIIVPIMILKEFLFLDV